MDATGHRNGQLQEQWFVIGVRESNYLVTALEWEKSAEVGPSRCAEVPINDSSRTRIMGSKTFLYLSLSLS